MVSLNVEKKLKNWQENRFIGHVQVDPLPTLLEMTSVLKIMCISRL